MTTDALVRVSKSHAEVPVLSSPQHGLWHTGGCFFCERWSAILVRCRFYLPSVRLRLSGRDKQGKKAITTLVG